ncbi:unnamed protein product [Schistosoma margrebowiei]|uniref:Uncharacterized protein n=1 Tax=Schistosoma margrebowiei TaxID=48269 RepID=A0A183LQG5_9TREM|nr:unnamed protein product [Schistosoma margrebowiei]
MLYTSSASKEWGDATRGLQMSTAKQAILKLGNKPIHTKNWRPQILVYLPLDENFQARHDRLLDLVYQLKAGHEKENEHCFINTTKAEYI